ncbi:formate dehydrogenase accessory sulfurtransferase FdhD [Xanthobacter agilis]|uniref:Sulfur carrier protein FdhD n=1 Tax=Xanthobacter agilis TaxID=47492 RepID=A0ABU0LC61_XANAG|nr:formate dehydrogenase accessory sulfurtransferase FdhD [Xanthobacter agilis]MDQ0504730.1 FdhD protein [Xanthobacter agilis]
MTDTREPPITCALPQDLPAPDPARRVARVQVRDDVVSQGTRTVPEETPVALTFNGTTHAVMMATPTDIRAFALGFALTEGIVAAPADILSIDELVVEDGIEARLWIAEENMRGFSARRRALAGPTGCGLCGVESLAEAVKPAARVTCNLRLTPAEILAAMAALGPLQGLNHETRAVHAAAYAEPDAGILAMAEDVGRHNALDKLVGMAVTHGFDTSKGLLVLTSRVSVEMVQKASVLGTGIIAAVSAPTALAIRTAEAAGITLCAVVRADGFEIFTHPERIALASAQERHAHVA